MRKQVCLPIAWKILIKPWHVVYTSTCSRIAVARTEIHPIWDIYHYAFKLWLYTPLDIAIYTVARKGCLPHGAFLRSKQMMPLSCR